MKNHQIKTELKKILDTMGTMEIITPLRKETDYYSIYSRLLNLLGKI